METIPSGPPKKDLDYYKKRLRKLRDDYSEEIPEKILSGISPDRKFKVRRNWWQGVVGSLLNTLKWNLITDPEIRAEVEEFTNHYKSEEFHDQPLTTARDIQRANEIINLVLGEKK